MQSASLQSSERKGADLETPQSPSGTLALFALQVKDPPLKLALNPVPGLYFMHILHQPLLNSCYSQEQLSLGCFSDLLFIWVFPALPIPPRDTEVPHWKNLQTGRIVDALVDKFGRNLCGYSGGPSHPMSL